MLSAVVHIHKKLKLLTLSNCRIDTQGAYLLSHAIKHTNNPLEQVNVGGNLLGRKGVAAVADAVVTVSSLVYVTVNNNNIPIPVSLFRGYHEQVDVSGQQQGLVGAIILSRMLRVADGLVHIGLAENWIGCDGARMFAEGMKSVGTLRSVNLMRNCIRAGGARALMLVMPFCNVTALNIGDNMLGPEGVDAITTSLKVRVVVGGGGGVVVVIVVVVVVVVVVVALVTV